MVDQQQRKQEIASDLMADVSAGPRRELILDDSAWEYLPVKQAGDRPPTGKWQPGRTLAHFPEGTEALWIRTRFVAPPWLKGSRYELYFGEVTYACEVYLNGQRIGQHIGPLFPFTVDATASLKLGEENLLELCVRDDCAGKELPPNSPVPGWYTYLWPLPPHYHGFGVLQETRLRTYPQVYVNDMFVMPSVAESRLGLRFEIQNTTDEVQNVQIAH